MQKRRQTNVYFIYLGIPQKTLRSRKISMEVDKKNVDYAYVNGLILCDHMKIRQIFGALKITILLNISKVWIYTRDRCICNYQFLITNYT